MAKFTFEHAAKLLNMVESQTKSLSEFLARVIQHIKDKDAAFQRLVANVNGYDFDSILEVYAWFYRHFVGAPSMR